MIDDEKRAIFLRACDEVANGRSFYMLSGTQDYPSHRTMHRWARSDETLLTAYQEALEDRAERLAQELLDLADFVDETSSAAIQACRLKTDVRKWLIEKQAPKRYGNKQAVELSGAVKVDHESVLEAARRRRESGSTE